MIPLILGWIDFRKVPCDQSTFGDIWRHLQGSKWHISHQISPTQSSFLQENSSPIWSSSYLYMRLIIVYINCSSASLKMAPDWARNSWETYGTFLNSYKFFQVAFMHLFHFHNIYYDNMRCRVFIFQSDFIRCCADHLQDRQYWTWKERRHQMCRSSSRRKRRNRTKWWQKGLPQFFLFFF